MSPASLASTQHPSCTVAIVEDEVVLREELAFQLRHHGFTVEAFETAAQLYRYLSVSRNIIAVLDIGLDGEDGLSICRHLRSHDSQIGIVFVTARGLHEDKLIGLAAGADVYLAKPIDVAELVLHLNRLSQRTVSSAEEQASEWMLHAHDWTLTSPSGITLTLTAKEHQLLRLLIQAHGEIVLKRDVIEHIFGARSINGDERIDVMLSRLRSKSREVLGEQIPLKTAHGTGYAFGAAASIL
jgi:DNA-binding response OmpR family regulator